MYMCMKKEIQVKLTNSLIQLMCIDMTGFLGLQQFGVPSATHVAGMPARCLYAVRQMLWRYHTCHGCDNCIHPANQTLPSCQCFSDFLYKKPTSIQLLDFFLEMIVTIYRNFLHRVIIYLPSSLTELNSVSWSCTASHSLCKTSIVTFKENGRIFVGSTLSARIYIYLSMRFASSRWRPFT